MVEGDAHPVVEVLAEQGDLGVSLAEVVEHDELCLHLHADADGLGGGAVHSEGEKHEGRETKYFGLQPF